MIRFEEQVSLKAYNTFGVDASARYFCRISTENDFIELISTPLYKKNRSLVLGGGSNVLFLNDFNGLIIRNELKGWQVTEETDTNIELKVGAGEVWHDVVMLCVEKNWGGIENLSLIPGTMGAAPMQNIGAYGVEAKEVIKCVDTIDRKTGEKKTFQNAECHFGYRESVFKQSLKEKFFISSVTLTLTKKNHLLNTSYGAIQLTLVQMNITSPTIKDVSNAVIQIRQNKLPDPSHIGNAGSFFKNPSLSSIAYEELKKEFPLIPGYFSDNQQVKVPAGWLIEACGWKGKRIGDAGVHAQQALVLVNYGNAKGEEIFLISEQIKSSVKKKFNIDLNTEVNIIS
jgi:UDP-N-acetylmuramate dehydrogenase